MMSTPTSNVLQFKRKSKIFEEMTYTMDTKEFSWGLRTILKENWSGKKSYNYCSWVEIDEDDE